MKKYLRNHSVTYIFVWTKVRGKQPIDHLSPIDIYNTTAKPKREQD